MNTWDIHTDTVYLINLNDSYILSVVYKLWSFLYYLSIIVSYCVVYFKLLNDVRYCKNGATKTYYILSLSRLVWKLTNLLTYLL